MRTTLYPLPTFEAVDAMMNRLFSTPSVTDSLSVPMDVFERDNTIFVRASVPGIDAENLQISLEDHVLTLKGERKTDLNFETDRVYRHELSQGSFTRTLRLPKNANPEGIQAEFRNGVVTISIPKFVEERKALQIPIKTA